jgi:hypothetical protein
MGKLFFKDLLTPFIWLLLEKVKSRASPRRAAALVVFNVISRANNL